LEDDEGHPYVQSYEGQVFLFDDNGNLLTTFACPSPEWSHFGDAIACANPSGVIIGAPYAAARAGTVYIFDTQGNLQTTITNPSPAAYSSFGSTITVVDTRTLLIGASPGELLMDMEGHLLQPVPQTRTRKTMVGRDKYAFGEPIANFTGSNFLGSATLAALDGTILTTYSNPLTNGFWFGESVVAMGPQTLAISAYVGTWGVAHTNVICVYDLNSNLLSSVALLNTRGFGSALTPSGNDKLLISVKGRFGTNEAYIPTLCVLGFRTYASDLISAGVKFGGVDTLSIAEGAVTESKLAQLLSANLARLDAHQTFTGLNTFAGQVSFLAESHFHDSIQVDGPLAGTSAIFGTVTAGGIQVDGAGTFGSLATGGIQVAGTTRTTVLQITSAREAKQGFAPVDAAAILAKVAALPLSTWAYTNAPTIRHLGPVAQDFHAAFGFGDSDKHIATVDADGVALAAIQGLYQLLKEKEARLAQLESGARAKDARIASLETRLTALEKALETRVAALEREAQARSAAASDTLPDTAPFDADQSSFTWKSCGWGNIPMEEEP
jgi:hypothetical protein